MVQMIAQEILPSNSLMSTNSTSAESRIRRVIEDRHPARKGDLICITDADGTYPNDRIPALVRQMHDGGYDMIVGRA